MSSLLVLWQRIFADPERQERLRVVPTVPGLTVPQTSATIFLILRRMRAPLIVLIVIFAVSVLGLSLTPGQDAQGRPDRMGIFESFYFMSYTATTIGFGEIPNAFTPEQRMWVTFAIFLSVIGWAYAIGSLLSLLQDRGFRRAVSLQRFVRAVRRLREPFYVVVGHGDAGQRLTRALDDVGRRFVVLDLEDSRITALELGAYRADAPAFDGNARNTRLLAAAGLNHPDCEGVLVLTGDDDANLDVTMTVALLRPDLRVIARTGSRDFGERMAAWGSPEVVNPFDRFGDHLRILLRSPASYQLMMWLTAGVGADLEPRRDPVPHGRWVVYGQGGFGAEIAADLRKEGVEVSVVGPEGDTFDRDALLAADLPHASGIVAATGSDTTNLSLVESALSLNPGIFLVARQNSSGNAPLYRSVGVDQVLVEAEVILHETLARLVNPLLLPFLRQVPHQGEAWSAALLDRITACAGSRLPEMWRVHLSARSAPALAPWLGTGSGSGSGSGTGPGSGSGNGLATGLLLGDLLRVPEGREARIAAVTLMVERDGATVLAPDDDFELADGDELLLVGRPSARRYLDMTLHDAATAEYVLTGRSMATGWLWRRLTSHR